MWSCFRCLTDRYPKVNANCVYYKSGHEMLMDSACACDNLSPPPVKEKAVLLCHMTKRYPDVSANCTDLSFAGRGQKHVTNENSQGALLTAEYTGNHD